MAAPPRTFTLLLAVHVAALLVSAIPSPESLRAASGTRESVDDDVSRFLRPPLDRGATMVVMAANALWRLTSPIRPLVRVYVSTLGLGQTWNMFASPPRGSQFLRLRHFVTEGTDPAVAPGKVFTEIVFPAAPDGAFRGMSSYWLSHRDKAASNAIEAYYQERDRRRLAGLSEPREGDAALEAALTRSFVPVVRYYHRRFVQSVRAGESVVRTEIWYGWAASPHRGDPRSADVERTAALARFAQGPVREGLAVMRRPIDSEETEADIRWRLLYVLGR